jgi:peptide/nickel transport system substrate-binding protein
MGEIPPQDAVRLDESSEYTLMPIPVPGQPLQFFANTQRSPLDDVQVRQALIYAVNRPAIVKTVFEAYSPAAYGPLNRSTFAYDPSLEDMYAYDPQQAAALLEEAGWSDSDADGIRDRDGEPLKLEAILMGWGYIPEVAQMLQDQLKQVGVSIEARQMTFSNALGEVAEGNYDLVPFLFSNSDPDILRTTFHSSNIEGGFNWSKFSDAQLDGWLEEGTQEMDEAARREIYASIQQTIMEQALILPIRDYVNLNAAQAGVENLRFDQQGWFPLLYEATVAEQ